METLKIEIPEGYEVDKFDPNTGELSFKETPKDIKERIKTFKDVLDYQGIELKDFTKSCKHLEDDEAAYRKLKLIVSALNEKWVPDWGDSNQNKYIPWFHMGGSSGSGFSYGVHDLWHSNSDCGSRLCFKTRELCEYAGEQFTDVYKDFFLINKN